MKLHLPASKSYCWCCLMFLTLPTDGSFPYGQHSPRLKWSPLGLGSAERNDMMDYNGGPAPPRYNPVCITALILCEISTSVTPRRQQEYQYCPSPTDTGRVKLSTDQRFELWHHDSLFLIFLICGVFWLLRQDERPTDQRLPSHLSRWISSVEVCSRDARCFFLTLYSEAGY